MPRKVSVIVISYNKVESVMCAVNSTLNDQSNSDMNIHIYIFDNSEDRRIFMQLKNNLSCYFNVSVEKNEKNIGFAKAANKGIIKSLEKGVDYILLLNDDAFIDKDCMKKLIEALENNNKALLAGPTIFYAKDTEKVWHTGGYLNRFLTIKIPYKNKKVPKEFLKKLSIQEVDFLTGCVLLIKREAFDKIGLFDENLFFYAEDLDYSIRVKKAGYKLLWVPYVFAWHDIDIIKGRTTPFVMYHLAKSNIFVRKKHLSRLRYFYYMLAHLLLLTPYRIFQVLIGSKDFKSIYAWFKGTLDGIKERAYEKR